jgi:hypothetical protein
MKTRERREGNDRRIRRRDGVRREGERHGGIGVE